jgi:hypothetical protein
MRCFVKVKGKKVAHVAPDINYTIPDKYRPVINLMTNPVWQKGKKYFCTLSTTKNITFNSRLNLVVFNISFYLLKVNH